MSKINILALFCEDIREEKNEQVSLIGILPDNLNVMPPEGITPEKGALPVFPKLCVLLRFNFEPDVDLPLYESRIVFPDGLVIPLGKLDTAIVEDARRNAREKGNPLAGLIVRAAFGSVRLAKPGVVRVEVQAGEEITVVAGINLGFPEIMTSATASSLPS